MQTRSCLIAMIKSISRLWYEVINFCSYLRRKWVVIIALIYRLLWVVCWQLRIALARAQLNVCHCHLNKLRKWFLFWWWIHSIHFHLLTQHYKDINKFHFSKLPKKNCLLWRKTFKFRVCVSICRFSFDPMNTKSNFLFWSLFSSIFRFAFLLIQQLNGGM